MVAALPRVAVVTVLFGVNLLNYMDRWSVASVLPELQAEFSISDAQGGLLTSAFVFSYMLLSPIFGFLGDRLVRKNIMAGGVAIWCVASLMGSFSSRFEDLLVCRSLVGVGEASYATIAPTLIADLFAVEERARWLSLYLIAVPLGSALGYVIGGTTAAYIGWRWAFRFTPISAAILMLILYFCMHEPPRGQADGGVSELAHPSSSLDQDTGCSAFFLDARDIWKTQSFVFSTFGMTCITFVLGALAQWGPSLLTRINCLEEKHVSECKYHINLIFGIISCITGIFGTLLGAWLSTRYSRPENSADAFLCSIGLALAGPCIALSLFVAPNSLLLSWVFIFLSEVAVTMTSAPVTAILLYVTIPRQRSLASGMQTLMMHLFGDASSPVLVGYIADYLHFSQGFDRGEGLQRALYPTAIWALLGSIFFVIAAVFLPRDRHSIASRLAEPIRYTLASPSELLVDHASERLDPHEPRARRGKLEVATADADDRSMLMPSRPESVGTS